MLLAITEKGKFVVAMITVKEANLDNADKFKEELLELIDKGNPNVVLNFEYVTYVDSSFLGAMVSGLKHALSKGADIYLIRLQKDIDNMLQLIRMDKVFKIYHDLSDIA